MTHPTSILWRLAGRPVPNWQGKAKSERTEPPSRQGVCCHTGEVGQVWDAKHLCSGLFTAWDRLGNYPSTDPAGPAFGPAAAWALRHRPGMQRPHTTMREGFTEANPRELLHALHALARDPKMFVTVPQSGQKHVTPFAGPGTVTTDDEHLPWGPPQAALLALYGRLRALGSGEAALMEPCPRWAVLQKLDLHQRAEVMSAWPMLDGWRRHPAYMDVAARATRTPKDLK